ncbi:type II toxin-antitoxin system VapC family toxin [Rhodopila sp.]|uniref:type II toxin-antitoxin system VapC family toxin n=1 Tax=Rhodopila sp. TaxID=2480087 RepID=UPI003D0F33AF
MEWLEGSRLGEALDNELPQPNECLVPTIVQLELAKWARRDSRSDIADQLVAFTTTCVVIDLTTAVALYAAELGAEHQLPTADAIIYATARAYDGDLLTCDRHFENLYGVRYLPKPTA